MFARTTKGVRFELARIQRVLAVAGDPHLRAPTVLIGGTNGKGSVTEMWARGLRADGRRVGKYTSPHLVRFNERIVVDGEAIEDGALGELFSRLDEAEARAGITLTFFEAATWMAFVHFAERAVDACVLEVGLGGRLDATNASDPVLSIITSIGLDHTEFLGDDLLSIAGEKAGIARIGRPLVVGPVGEEVLATIEARALRAQVWAVGREQSHLAPVPPAMWGEHQRENAAVFALSVSAARGGPLAIGREAFEEGCRARVAGRYEVRTQGGVRSVIDGAHNGDAARALRESLIEDPAFGRPRALVFGGTQGRPPATTLGALAPLFDRIVLCQPRSERALPMGEMLAVAPAALCAGSIAEAFSLAAMPHVCVTGSLYLVGDALSYLDNVARDTLTDFR